MSEKYSRGPAASVAWLSRSRLLGLALLAMLVTVQACDSSSPTGEEEEAADTDTQTSLVCVDGAAQPTFTPYTVAPELTNPTDVERALERAYPPLLRDAGIGGTVQLGFNIGTEGQVLQVCLAESSGHPPLDEAALEVAEIMEFEPALNGDEVVEVWIQLPIIFRVKE